jgi:hypothetical protein
MNRLLPLFALVLAVGSAAAQDFFGITPEVAQGMIAQAKAQEREEHLRALGWAPSNFPSVGKALGYTKSLASAQYCVYDAVAARLGADARLSVDFPDVLYASDVDVSRFQAAYKGQFPTASVPDSIQTVYMPNYNVIYVADAASAYKDGATMDDALAGQYARFIDSVVRGVSDQSRIDADAAAVQTWYRAQYPAGASSCGR